MRLRFFSYFYPPCIGGGEVILQHQAEELARRGHEVHVHTTPFTNMDGSSRVECGSAVENGVHVHRRPSGWLPFRTPMEKNAVTPAFAADAARPADVLVCVGFPAMHLHLLAARHRVDGTPLVVQNYITADALTEILAGEGGWNRRVRSAYWRMAVRGELSAASVVIADSPAAGRALREQLGLTNVCVHIGMAVDPGEFASVTAAERSAVRRQLGLGDARILLAPSRISRQKGADLLVEAALPLLDGACAAGEGWKGRGRWKLVISGPVNEQEFAGALRARASCHLDIVFTQLPRPQLLALFAEADIVALPSRGETVGGVVFEGMYAGAVCVVSDGVEAARDDYLRDGQNGLLVPREDVPALRAALARAMREPLSDLRAAARRMVEERFTWSASVDRLLELYPRA